MSNASRESSKSLFESWSEKFSNARERLKRSWRRSSGGLLESNTDVPAADDHSFASFHSDPTITDEAKVSTWDDAQPELVKIKSFALSEEMLNRIEDDDEGNEVGRPNQRLMKKFGFPAAATAVIVVAVVFMSTKKGFSG
eukprot:g6749.t1